MSSAPVAGGWGSAADLSAARQPLRVAPQIAVAVWVSLCFVFAAVNRTFLPDKYFADSDHLQGLALTATGPSPDSFITMAWLYRSVGGFAAPVVTQLITLALFFALVFRCAGWLEIARFGPTELVLFCFGGAEAAIYLAQYSKESLVVLIVLALAALPRALWGDVLFLALACGYAYLIRNYWFIIAVLYVAFRLLLRTRKPSRLVPLVALAMLAMALGTSVALGVNLNSFREAVAQTNSLYATTAIQDYLPVAGPFGGAANALCTLVLLIVPVPLLFAGSPVYLVFAGLMTLLWLTLFAVVRTGMRGGWFRTDTRLSRAVSLLLAMVVAQAVFEPDYGSYIKHLTPLLPLFFAPLLAWRKARGTARPARTVRTARQPGRTGKTIMSLSTILRAVLRSWYITVPGLLVSLIIAAAVFSLIPTQYTSSGVAVLVQQKKPLPASAANPLLAGDGSLNTTNLTLIEALNTGAVKQQLGVPDGGTDSYTVTNVGSSTVADGTDHPFLYITARSTDAQRSADIVASVLSQARQDLSSRQTEVRVPQQNQIKLQSVVDATAPKPVLVTKFAFSGAVLALGLILSCIGACTVYTRGRQRPAGPGRAGPLAPAPYRPAGPGGYRQMPPGWDRPGLDQRTYPGLPGTDHRAALRPGPRPIQAGDTAPPGGADLPFPDRWVGSGN